MYVVYADYGDSAPYNGGGEYFSAPFRSLNVAISHAQAAKIKGAFYADVSLESDVMSSVWDSDRGLLV